MDPLGRHNFKRL